ncbi:hypothetical protein AAKU67_001663 [Oxalobacteraceae bacterium GrIS 2.11]
MADIFVAHDFFYKAWISLTWSSDLNYCVAWLVVNSSSAFDSNFSISTKINNRSSTAPNTNYIICLQCHTEYGTLSIWSAVNRITSDTVSAIPSTTFPLTQSDCNGPITKSVSGMEQQVRILPSARSMVVIAGAC